MHALLSRISRLRILVVGDLMLDHYIWGDVHRVSPEAPVPVVHATRDSWAAGGAANVALNLAGLGARARVLGHIGSDEAGARLREILAAHQIEVIPTLGADTTPTIVKTRVIARTQQLCRIDREAPAAHYQPKDADLPGLVRMALEGCDAVIFSDYAKGLISQALLDAFKAAAAEKGILLAMDPKPSRPLDLRGLGLLTPNRTEALQLAGMPAPDPGESFPVEQVCQAIQERHAPGLLALTLGADGMAIASHGRISAILPTEAREVFDVSGAGDTVIASLTAALAAGEASEAAAQFANRAAGIVVGHMGTVPISRTELESL